MMFVTIFDDHKDVDPEYLVPSNPERAGHLGTRKGAGLVGLQWTLQPLNLPEVNHRSFLSQPFSNKCLQPVCGLFCVCLFFMENSRIMWAPFPLILQHETKLLNFIKDKIKTASLFHFSLPRKELWRLISLC